MGFLAGQSSFHADPATGNAQFTEQKLLPSISQAQSDYARQLGQADQIYGQQGDLANMLLAQSQGQGPNIAQMQLQQATNRNIQQGAGLIGSARGMNPALQARLIANQTANANQQAAGQSGLMRAQQQLAAQGALANVYGQQGNLALGGGQLANQNLGLNQSALQAQNGQIVGAKDAADKLNAQVAASNAAGMQAFTNKLISGAGAALAGPMGSMFSAAPSAASLAAPVMGGSSMMSGTGMDAVQSGGYNDNALAGLVGGSYEGGEIKGYAEGGETYSQKSKDYIEKTMHMFEKNKVHSGSKEGPVVHDPKQALAIAFSEARSKGMKVPQNYKGGGHVPGQPQYPGNDPRNDTIPAMLSPGEVVLPNSITQSPDADEKAKAFMAAIQKDHEKKQGPKGFAKVLEAKRKMQEAMKHMDEAHKMMKDKK